MSDSAVSKLVCLGDSLTEGYAIDLRVRWTTLLRESTGLDIVNSGISGDTTGGMLARFERDVLAHHPSHLLLMGGTNDLWMQVPFSVIMSNILAITRQAKYHNIAMIIGVPPAIYPPAIPGTDPPIYADHKKLAQDMLLYQDQLRQLIRRDQWPFVDFSELAPTFFLADGVHINEAGQGAMQRLVEDLLRTIHS